jgi:hypothetical protein
MRIATFLVPAGDQLDSTTNVSRYEQATQTRGGRAGATLQAQHHDTTAGMTAGGLCCCSTVVPGHLAPSSSLPPWSGTLFEGVQLCGWGRCACRRVVRPPAAAAAVALRCRLPPPARRQRCIAAAGRRRILQTLLTLPPEQTAAQCCQSPQHACFTCAAWGWFPGATAPAGCLNLKQRVNASNANGACAGDHVRLAGWERAPATVQPQGSRGTGSQI